MSDDIPQIKNPRHKAFADAILQGTTGTQALIDLGYSVRTAGAQAGLMIKKPQVAAYIAWHRSEATEQTKDLVTRIAEELEAMSFANIQDFTRVDSNGDPIVDFSKSTRSQLRAITSVKTKTTTRLDSKGREIVEKQSGFTMADKYRGLELLGKHVGMFKADEQRVVIDVADRLLAARRRVIDHDDGGVD